MFAKLVLTSCMYEMANFFLPFPFQLLCLIGEAFDDSSFNVCGAVVSIRNKGDKLGLWTRDVRNAEANLKIG